MLRDEEHRPLYFCHFDNVGVNAMRRRFEATTVSSEASLLAGFALRATVAVDTLWVITLQSKAAWCHAGNGGQNVQFLLGQLAVMVVVTILLVGALSKQEMIIAQLQLLQSIQLVTRNTLEIETIDTLSIFVPLNGFRRARARCLGSNDLEF